MTNADYNTILEGSESPSDKEMLTIKVFKKKCALDSSCVIQNRQRLNAAKYEVSCYCSSACI